MFLRFLRFYLKNKFFKIVLYNSFYGKNLKNSKSLIQIAVCEPVTAHQTATKNSKKNSKHHVLDDMSRCCWM